MCSSDLASRDDTCGWCAGAAAGAAWRGHHAAQEEGAPEPDRKSVVQGKSVDIGGRRNIKKKKKTKENSRDEKG